MALETAVNLDVLVGLERGNIVSMSRPKYSVCHSTCQVFRSYILYNQETRMSEVKELASQIKKTCLKY